MIHPKCVSLPKVVTVQQTPRLYLGLPYVLAPALRQTPSFAFAKRCESSLASFDGYGADVPNASYRVALMSAVFESLTFHKMETT